MENVTSTVTIERTEYDSLLASKAENEKLETLIKWYESQLLSAKRRQFGTSSETTDIDPQQIGLFAEVASTLTEPETEEISYQRKKQTGKRERDLSGLPVERVDYVLTEAERLCPVHGTPMREVGVDIRRSLELIPAKVVVKEEAIHVYACRPCETEGIKTTFLRAKAPPALIPGSLASPSLVAHIAAQKYSNGMPLYRIEKGFRYDGVNISRQTMCNWNIKCSEMYLEPLYERLKEHLVRETVIASDETPVQVLREDGRAAQTKSYEWVYRTGTCAKRQIVLYEYKETRKQEHPQKFLKDFKGFLHTDGYQVYHNLPPGIVVVGCWSHVRRRFEAILKNAAKNKHDAPNAERGVAYCNALFALERAFAELTPEERRMERLEKSKPIADEFFAWAAGLCALPKSPLGEAVKYALSQKPYLENVWLDGRTEISNNRCEQAVKPFVMGRKAWLFSCTPAGARASSVMYSIIETAKANGLHPTRYLEFLLKTLPGATTSDLDPLLPWSDALPAYCKALPGADAGK